MRLTNAWISLSELRLGLRFLRKQPVVTLTTVLTLAVGIGMATTGFTLLESVLYSKLPYPNGDRFVLLVGDFAANAPPVAVVNEPFVAKFFAGRNPVGQRIRTLPSTPGAEPGPWREVVGVVPDLGLSAGDQVMAGGVYLPLTSDHVFHLVVRAAGDARPLAGRLRTTIDALDPTIQIREVRPLHDVGREDRAVFAGIGAALAALGGVAMLLSVIGTYAILSLSVTRRTREIGIRTALGASRRQVLQAIMTRTCLPPALGAVLGVALGQGLVAARGIFAFRLPEGSGPWGLPVLAAVMITAGLLSAWVPARRALAVAPAEALRAE